MKICTVDEDNRTICILRALQRGSAPFAIAAKFGVSKSYVSVIRHRVMADDLAESSTEDPQAVIRAYHPQGVRARA